MTPSSSLCLEDELFLVLIRLQLGLFLQDLANCFRVFPLVVLRTFQKWLDVMCARPASIISWPAHENNMPVVFRFILTVSASYCSEIFIEMPKNFDTHSKTYSNYNAPVNVYPHYPPPGLPKVRPGGLNSPLYKASILGLNP